MTKTEESAKSFIVKVYGCDELHLQLLEHDAYHLEAIACESTLQLLREYRRTQQPPQKWSLPQGNSHSELLLKELILKARGEWNFPYSHVEICHCRAIATEKVDQAILCGARDIPTIRKLTSASTACGTCQQDIEGIIRFRSGL